MKGQEPKLYLIFADNYVTWCDAIGEFLHNDSYFGSYTGAHEYARGKYGKYYTLKLSTLNP